jgi:hypothetical protein
MGWEREGGGGERRWGGFCGLKKPVVIFYIFILSYRYGECLSVCGLSVWWCLCGSVDVLNAAKELVMS